MKINGILTTIVLLSFFLLYGCRNRTARIEDEVTESVVQDTIYPEFRWEICIDSLDIHSGIIGRNEVLSTILGRHGVGASVLHEVETVSKDISQTSGRKNISCLDRPGFSHDSQIFCL